MIYACMYIKVFVNVVTYEELKPPGDETNFVHVKSLTFVSKNAKLYLKHKNVSLLKLK